MGLFKKEKCNNCNKSIGFFDLTHDCDFCQKEYCSNCIEKIYFSDYYGYLDFFVDKLKDDFEIRIPNNDQIKFVPSGEDLDYGETCLMCYKCQQVYEFDNFSKRYKKAVKNAKEITVIKGSSTKLNANQNIQYRMQVNGSKLDLIEAFTIKAYLEGYEYIYEIITDKERGVWTGSCKAGKFSK